MVIVGAGQAAAQAVETLRKRGHAGPLTLVGDEDLLPYQRPPLSKKYLAGATGTRSAADPPCRPLRRACRRPAAGVRGGAASIARAQRVEIADGVALRIRPLLLATGSQPRLLPVPGAELAGVHYLRTRRGRGSAARRARARAARRDHRRRLHRPRSGRHLPRSGARGHGARGGRPRDEPRGRRPRCRASTRRSMPGMA